MLVFEVEDGLVLWDLEVLIFGILVNSTPRFVVLRKDFARPKNSLTVGWLYIPKSLTCYYYFLFGKSNSISSIFVSLVPKKEPPADGVATDSEIWNLFSGPFPSFLILDSWLARDYEDLYSIAVLQHLHLYTSYFFGPGLIFDNCIWRFMFNFINDIIKNAANYIIYIINYIIYLPNYIIFIITLSSISKVYNWGLVYSKRFSSRYTYWYSTGWVSYDACCNISIF